jgi:hypothetical protein
MSRHWDRYNLAARLERFGDQLMSACEQGEAIDNRVDVCVQAGAVCRIVTTLKALRTEARDTEPEDGIAGSSVRKYSPEFATRRAASAKNPVEAASDPFVEEHPSWTDPAEEFSPDVSTK